MTEIVTGTDMTIREVQVLTTGETMTAAEALTIVVNAMTNTGHR